MSNEKEFLQEVNSLPEKERSLIVKLVHLLATMVATPDLFRVPLLYLFGHLEHVVHVLARRASADSAHQRPVKLGGRWKGRVPDDFDVEKALAELRRSQQSRLDDLATG